MRFLVAPVGWQRRSDYFHVKTLEIYTSKLRYPTESYVVKAGIPWLTAGPESDFGKGPFPKK
jgi:hypothetical protein